MSKTEWEAYVQQVQDWLFNVEEVLHYEEREHPLYYEDVEQLLTQISTLKTEIPPTDDIELCQRFAERFEEVVEAYDQLRLETEKEWSETAYEDDSTDFDDVDENELRGTEEERAEQANTAGQHELPPLPYDYDALEPVISERIMKLHHDKHHRSYVEGLNKAEMEMAKARATGRFNLIRHWEREAAFNGAGHYLHTIFWNIMSPNGGGRPRGELASQIEKDFSSFDAFKKHFSEAAKNVEGVGWAILVWSPRSHRLEILQAEFHQNLSQWDVIPLLVLDVWEHAYYLQYLNDRANYVDEFWKVIDWSAVASRFNKAKKLKWDRY